MDSFGALFLLSQCWFFASHYLSVAYLFRLTFSETWQKNIKEIEIRKKRLLYVNVAFYSFLIASWAM